MSNFRFLDDTDAQRQLGVDRLTFEDLLRTKRLRPVSGQGTIQFFRAADIARLRAELERAAAPPPGPLPILADGEGETASEADRVDLADQAKMSALPSPSADGEGPGVGPLRKKKSQDPPMRVHVRLTADLKWYDISDADLQAWFDQLHPETYTRRRANAIFIMQRMQQIVDLIDAGQAQLDAASGRGGETEVEG